MNTENVINDITYVTNQIKTKQESINQSTLMQKIIERKRDFQSKIVSVNNKCFLSKLKERIIKDDFDENTDVIYISKYICYGT